MNVLCFSDLHRDQDAAKRLVKLAADADLVLVAGDFATRHEGLADTLEILRQIDCPMVFVPGNGETFPALRDAAASMPQTTVLHGTGQDMELDSETIPIWGLGGGIPVTPFGDWSYDFDEQEAEGMLSDCPVGGILLTHSPPINTVDNDSNGKVRGSTSIRRCIERCQPKLVVCGHLHSDWGKRVTLGNTLILNVGPGGVMITL